MLKLLRAIAEGRARRTGKSRPAKPSRHSINRQRRIAALASLSF